MSGSKRNLIHNVLSEIILAVKNCGEWLYFGSAKSMYHMMALGMEQKNSRAINNKLTRMNFFSMSICLFVGVFRGDL